MTNWREGEDNFNGEMVRAKARESAPLGERETLELTKYWGMNGSQWNDEGAWERRGRSEFPDQRK